MNEVNLYIFDNMKGTYRNVIIVAAWNKAAAVKFAVNEYEGGGIFEEKDCINVLGSSDTFNLNHAQQTKLVYNL